MTAPVTFRRSSPRTSRCALATSCSAARVSANTGRRRSARARPAAVGVTLRVVRIGRGVSSLVSRWATVSLTVEGERPSRLAAERNPRSGEKHGQIVQPDKVVIVRQSDRSLRLRADYQRGSNRDTGCGRASASDARLQEVAIIPGTGRSSKPRRESSGWPGLRQRDRPAALISNGSWRPGEVR